MQASDLRPARDFARQYGVKSIVHGAAGTGKTPILNTAPRPILLACEPGLGSMRNSTVPTRRVNNADECDDFFKWWFNSKEARGFDTLGIDSASEMATQYLWRAERVMKDGRQIYGKLLDDLMGDPWDDRKPAIWRRLFYMPQTHIYMICKQAYIEVEGPMNTRVNRAVPMFPGKALNVDVPHLYDLIMHLGDKMVPGNGMQRAFQTKGSNEVLARDRSGMLAEYEYPDLTAIFNKAMS